MKWGVNSECRQIVEELGSNKTWINSFGCSDLLVFYRRDTSANPEWRWKLSRILPKASMLRVNGESYIYNFDWNRVKSLATQVKNNNIKQVAIVESTLRADPAFNYSQKVTLLQQQPWLHLDRVINYKNKKLYVFTVVESYFISNNVNVLSDI
jgi:hypothetical protein